jgi:hypothetical protein
MTFDRRRSELEARSLRRLDLPRVYHENQIAELDAHNSDGSWELGRTSEAGIASTRLPPQNAAFGCHPLAPPCGERDRVRGFDQRHLTPSPLPPTPLAEREKLAERLRAEG